MMQRTRAQDRLVFQLNRQFRLPRANGVDITGLGDMLIGPHGETTPPGGWGGGLFGKDVSVETCDGARDTFTLATFTGTIQFAFALHDGVSYTVSNISGHQITLADVPPNSGATLEIIYQGI